ncbi:Aste57867_1166 [Aphanomyces stellatus]|uniref:Aste57867_1166 protein n=1 Tax=Aphanomyces stellatus TaxID=120398 RepID=A0A485K8N7_9STRA|nr:hypothetical protein As57867_001165 [Aphanomyces stellatus]VFT78386.1 Aste57867_1166 [Aphanomyces stellatus]
MEDGSLSRPSNDGSAERRRYFRDKQRLQRIKNNASRKELQRQVAGLEAALAVMKEVVASTTPRPHQLSWAWADVASVRKDARADANEALKGRVAVYTPLVEDVGASSAMLVHPPSSHRADVNSIQQRGSPHENDMAHLKQQVAALEACLVLQTSALPWYHVNLALQQARAATVEDNQRWRRRVGNAKALAQELKTWVTTIFRPVPRKDATSWHHITLLASPVSRQQGKAWIVQRMVHHMDHLFMTHGFGAPLADDDEMVDDISVSPPDNHCVVRYQSRLPLPVDVLVGAYRAHFCELTMMDIPIEEVDSGAALACRTHTLRETTAATSLHSVSLRHGTCLDEDITMLVGEVRQRHRVVLVAQAIDTDELHGRTPGGAARGCLYWMDIRAADATSSYVRLLFVMTPMRRGDAVIPLEEEVVVWRIDPDATRGEHDDVRHAKWRHEMREASRRVVDVVDARRARIITEYMHSM